MSTSRRAKIEAMLAEEPGDTFLRYSLALELEKEGSHDESQRHLGELTRGEPPYVPAFLMAAQQMAGLDRAEDARAVLRNGIEVSRRSGDSHAAAEMGELLARLGSAG